MLRFEARKKKKEREREREKRGEIQKGSATRLFGGVMFQTQCKRLENWQNEILLYATSSFIQPMVINLFTIGLDQEWTLIHSDIELSFF
jgi:hypothetical protein